MTDQPTKPTKAIQLTFTNQLQESNDKLNTAKDITTI